MPGMPMGQAAPSSPFAMMGGADTEGADSVQQALTELMGQIRDVTSQIDTIGQTFPALAQETQQIRLLLKAMIVKAAKQVPAQDLSAEAPPTASM